MIVCDYCDARTRQPLPHGWRVLWLPELKAYGHACSNCEGFELKPREAAPSIAAALEAAVRDELGLPAAEVDYAPAVVAEVVHGAEPEVVHRDVTPPTDAPVLSHGTDAPASEVDEPVGRARRDAGAIRPPVPKLIEPAPGVEIYDRPRLPRTLRDAPDGASVEAFVRAVGETFVPPAATRPRAAAPLVKSPSEPPAPAQRSLFGGES